MRNILTGGSSTLQNHLAKGINFHCRTCSMDHGVAIRADWPKVANGINLVLATNLTERDQMVNVDEAIADLAVDYGKIEPTD